MTDSTTTAHHTAATETGTDKTLIERAQEAVTSAVGSTVSAVKENPGTAAAIAGGVAAVAAGAAYGVSKLREEDTPKKSAAKSGGSKATTAKH